MVIDMEDLMFEWYYNGLECDGIDEENMIRIVSEIVSKYVVWMKCMNCDNVVMGIKVVSEYYYNGINCDECESWMEEEWREKKMDGSGDVRL